MKHQKQSILVFDLECATYGNFIDPMTSHMRFFGGYSYLMPEKGVFFLTEKHIDTIRKVIDKHKFIVGYNIKKYDIPILENLGISFNYKIIIDLYDIIEKRKLIMKHNGEELNLLLKNSKLDEVTQVLGLTDETIKKDTAFDYKVLNKKAFTEEDIKYILTYLNKDVLLEKRLFEYLDKYFDSFKSFLEFDDVQKKKYLTSSTAVFAYKAICKATGLKEEYEDVEHSNESQYTGGYVGYPSGEKFEGDIYCLDYNSLYPSIMIQANLYSRKKGLKGWRGGDLFTTTGVYRTDEMSVVGKTLMRFYEQRLQFKKDKDPREYSIKVIINTIYGLLGNKTFKSVCDQVAAGDCTKLGEQIIKYTRKRFYEEGYELIYTDTDSVYILDPFHDKNKLINISNEIVKEVQSTFHWKWKHFGMGIDDEIKCMWFFKPVKKKNNKEERVIEADIYDKEYKKLGFMQKNYIYVTKDDKVKIKNLGLKKKNNSPLSKLLFKKYIEPTLIETCNLKYTQQDIQKWIDDELSQDLSLIAIRYPVKPTKAYKNKTQLQYQVSEKYGPGIHFLIANNIYGVGKAKNYCTIEEFREKKIPHASINMDKLWSEMGYFIKRSEAKSLSKWIKK